MRFRALPSCFLLFLFFLFFSFSFFLFLSFSVFFFNNLVKVEIYNVDGEVGVSRVKVVALCSRGPVDTCESGARSVFFSHLDDVDGGDRDA